jgi:hypothetical protein
MFPGLGQLDPSKLSPQTIAEVSALMQTLSHEQMMKMQSLMHNSMAGFDVSKEMQAFEQSLPSSFKEKMARIMYLANGIEVPPLAPIEVRAPTNEREARLTILRSVAGGLMSPEDALSVLFP